MSLDNYLVRKVCELAKSSLGGSSFGEDIFEYDSLRPNEFKVWGGLVIKILEEGEALKISLMQQDMKDRVLSKLKENFNFSIDSKSKNFLEYVKAAEGDVLLEAKLKSLKKYSNYNDDLFNAVYKSAISPTLGAILALRRSGAI